MVISPGLLAAFLFASFFIVVALVLVSTLLRDYLSKQKTYSCLAKYVGELFIVISKSGHLLDASPKYVSDSLYELLLRKKSFRQVLPATEYRRLQEYIRSVMAYPDIPFIFSFNAGTVINWYELRACVKKKNENIEYVILLKNVTLDVESRNQRDLLQSNVDTLLQNTGDFLWSINTDSREFTFLTPLIDSEGRVVPRSLGVHDIRAMMPKEDYSFFEKYINSKIVDFRNDNGASKENKAVRLRLLGENGKLEWFAFCGKLYAEDNARLSFRGAARKLDLSVDNFIIGKESFNEKSIVSILDFPDIRIFWIDRQYKICGCNQAFSLAFGMSMPDNAIGKRLLEVVLPKYFPFFHGIISDVFERGVSRSWKGPFGLGKKLLWLNAVPLKREDGFVYRVLGIYMLMDVNEFDSYKKLE